MADESNEGESNGDSAADESGDGEEKSFRERVEEIRQQRAEQEGEEGEDVRSPAEEMMGGGGMGGNPFAQMMGGMMGGGAPGMGGGPGGPGGPGGMGRGRGEESAGSEELVREVQKLRDEVHDVRRSLDRIADALEDD